MFIINAVSFCTGVVVLRFVLGDEAMMKGDFEGVGLRVLGAWGKRDLGVWMGEIVGRWVFAWVDGMLR